MGTALSPPLYVPACQDGSAAVYIRPRPILGSLQPDVAKRREFSAENSRPQNGARADDKPLTRDAGERVRFAFGNRRMGDADELRFLFEFRNGFRADVAHAYLEARCERSDYLPYGAFVRHKRFDAFGYRLASVGEIAFGARGAFDDGLRAHAAVFLEFTSVFLDDFAWGLVGACKEIAEHDR